MNKHSFLCYALVCGWSYLFVPTWLHSQPQLENTSCGRIVNAGRIEVRGTLSSHTNGTIDNRRGIVTITGNAHIEQAILEGRTEFLGDTINAQQRVPAITYSVLYFRGKSVKLLDTSVQQSLVSRDTFVVEQPSQLRMARSYPVIVLGRFHHDGSVNDDGTYGEVILRGSQQQYVSGRGILSALQLDNSSSVQVVDSANLRIRHTLFLNRGILQNSVDANLTMNEGSLVIRTDSASVVNFLRHGNGNERGVYSVQYQGNTRITTGNEIPEQTDVLKSLVVVNDGGLLFDRNVNVNDSLIVGTSQQPTFIFTEHDSANRYVLTYRQMDQTLLDPIYAHPRSEVIGSFQRVGLRADSVPQLYTNRYTWVALRVPQNQVPGSITVRTLPKTFPPYPDGNTKVQRAFFIEANGLDSLPLRSLPMTVGYGWLDTPSDPTTNESNGLDRERVILLHWDGTRWRNIRSSRTPAQWDTLGWAYSLADTVSVLGPFAIGYPVPALVCLDARVLLEGPYCRGTMATDLAQRGLLPETPPAIYPYNRDPNRANIRVQRFDSTIVDWVVVELRPSLTSANRIYRTALLRHDGAIVDIDGNSRLCYGPKYDTSSYYVAIHHRNHLAIISADALRLASDEQPAIAVTLSAPSRVLGAAAALKPIDYDPTNGVIFGMVAGDVNGDGAVDISDRADYDAIWNGCVEEGYLNRDTDLSGIVTTRDANKTWNNRGRTTNVPR